MLQAYLPPGWALFGALLAAARLGVTSYWINSYWGGAAAAIGGALAFGAYGRLRKDLRPVYAVVMALGIVILANSRPYEGLFTCLCLLVGLLAGFWKRYRGEPDRWLRRLALPAGALLLLGFAWMGYYNWRGTGDPAQFPYQVNHERYSIAGLFPWTEVRPEPEYNHPYLRDLYVNFGLYRYRRTETLDKFLRTRFQEYLDESNFYLGPLLVLSLVTVPWMVWDRRIRFLLLSFLAVLAACSLTISFQAHYWAPITCVIWALFTQSIRHLAAARWGVRPTGRAMVALLPWLVLASLAWCPVEQARATPENTHYRHKQRCKPPDRLHPLYQRAVAKERLEAMEGRHLVLVRYGAGHLYYYDWVFNGANIDGQRIVWARDFDPRRNQELIDYFKDRKVWLAEVTNESAYLLPYEPGASE